MPEKIVDREAPSKLLELAFKAPRWLFRMRLGGLLGNRFLLLRHTGRVSGQPRETVLEVAGYNPESDVYFVVSAYGANADWYLNLLKTPQAQISVGRRTIEVRAEKLAPAESGELIVSYAREHPTAIKQLSRFMGYKVDGTEEDYYALGEMLHAVALIPGSP
ncbi:MAG: nitroreductase family deazaflavin-dependent oxidoreductase [Anaerolineales bacterium]|nr:nitroreductase family deazaflavin-dependent oxidoreductase [Anaerolineales bacterium]